MGTCFSVELADCSVIVVIKDEIVMINFEIEEATPEEKSAIEQQVRFVDDAARRVAARKVKAKEDARQALLDNLASKERGKPRL